MRFTDRRQSKVRAGLRFAPDSRAAPSSVTRRGNKDANVGFSRHLDNVAADLRDAEQLPSLEHLSFRIDGGRPLGYGIVKEPLADTCALRGIRLQILIGVRLMWTACADISGQPA